MCSLALGRGWVVRVGDAVSLYIFWTSWLCRLVTFFFFFFWSHRLVTWWLELSRMSLWSLVPYTLLFIIKNSSFSEKQTIVAQWLGPNLKILSNSFGAFILFVFILLSEIIIFPSKQSHVTVTWQTTQFNLQNLNACELPKYSIRFCHLIFHNSHDSVYRICTSFFTFPLGTPHFFFFFFVTGFLVDWLIYFMFLIRVSNSLMFGRLFNFFL